MSFIKILWVGSGMPSSVGTSGKQCVGVCFGLYGIAYWMPIQQKLIPPELLFSVFVGWDDNRLFYELRHEHHLPHFHEVVKVTESQWDLSNVF